MTAYAPSNGTMGHLWMSEWCFRCVHDHGFSHVLDETSDPDLGCPLVVRMMTEAGPFDFLDEASSGGVRRPSRPRSRPNDLYGNAVVPAVAEWLGRRIVAPAYGEREAA